MRDLIKLKLTVAANGELALKLPDDFDYADDTNVARVGELLALARALAGVR